MAEIDHWNPVLLARALGRKPRSVRVAGRELVVYRTKSGAVGALDEACPHRRMRLSTGCVVGERLQCPYHGWTFAADGCGESPGTPKLQARTTSYETREVHGVVWLKSADSTAEFPHFDVDGYYRLGSMSHLARAPLETTLDNFCEIEHTPTTHALFGYPLERMHEVTTRTEADEVSVRVVNAGPHKAIQRLFKWFIGLRGDVTFVDDWTTRFSPLYTVFDHAFHESATGKPSRLHWRIYLFLTPLSADETLVTTITYVRSTFPLGPYGGVRVIWPILWRMIEREVALDCKVLKNLADKRPQLDGMKLSRFDRALGLNRERIERIYRGNATIPLLHTFDPLSPAAG